VARLIWLRLRRARLSVIDKGIDALENALDAERRSLMHANEQRLAAYQEAARKMSEIWKDIEREMGGVPLTKAHAIMIRYAEKSLPLNPLQGIPHA
jgi:hypothetical protein